MNRKLLAFFLIFTLSGFSGLIYESIWTHYLKLFLGHAAYAQTLVLAIFMGGLALGSWICSRYSVTWKNLLIGYAIAEGAIGFFALFFHNVFDHIVQISYAVVIPNLNLPAVVSIYKWTLSALMILPQSILLGMTFPLMSAGIIRLSPQNPGRTISLLYFTNSIGAVIGVLASGFILIRLIGLPWTMRTAGFINIALALTVWLLLKGRDIKYPVSEVERKNTRSHQGSGWYLFLLVVSLITGMASFIYEIGWIRMLSLVLGSSTHAFELMLSAFIFGLACGGLWIQGRIDRIVIPERFLANVQIVMGLLALSTLPLYGHTFELMQWLVRTLSKTAAGYALFNLSSNAIASAIMLPTTFCAGMTLPLITFKLIKQGYGERSIGAVYAANTVGAIIGVFFAIHLGMPVLGLKGLITVGASLDIALGLALLWSVITFVSNRAAFVITITCICAVAATLFFVKLDAYKMASGVYRQGNLLSMKDNELIFHRDGKTATVSLSRDRHGVISIRTNGKVDAGINMTPPPYDEAFPDESTMILLGMMPMTINPQAAQVAVIGFGSGLTTHTVLSNPRIKQVDTVEIERYMIEGSKYFRPRVELAYTDPRSKVYIDDAKTFFSNHKKMYDIIISEPSNPWVSGVAGLFSKEFYRQINNHLTENGLFVQWVQLYEIDVNLVVSVLKAISSNYSDFTAYAPTDGDMIVIARKTGMLSEPDFTALLKIPDIVKALKRIKIESIQDIDIRRIGNKKTLTKMLETYPIRANSDYYPVLDQNAARTRFLQANAQDFLDYTHVPLPALELLMKNDRPWRITDVTPSVSYYPSQSAFAAMALRDYCLHGDFDPRYGLVPQEMKEIAVRLNQIFYDCRSTPDPGERFFTLFRASILMTPYLRPHELDAIWEKLESGPCAGSLSATERKWITLFKAVGRRDARAIASEAKNILESELQLPEIAENYLVAAAMLSSLVQGDKEESHNLWLTYQSEIFGAKEPDLLFRLLKADSDIAH